MCVSGPLTPATSGPIQKQAFTREVRIEVHKFTGFKNETGWSIMSIKSNAVKGFTLIEMMMTLSIAAILITVALPSYNTFTQNSRITTQTNKIVAAIALARGEAAKRGTRVVLCRTNDYGDADPDCSGSGGTAKDWSNGWLVFAVGTSRTTPLYDPSQDDVLLAQFSPESGVDIMTSSANDKNLEFNPDGTTNESGSTANFAVCDARGVSHGNRISIAPTGRASTGDATTCTP